MNSRYLLGAATVAIACTSISSRVLAAEPLPAGTGAAEPAPVSVAADSAVPALPAASPAPMPAPAPAEPAKPSTPSSQFEFGSYGRVRIASDLRGGTARLSNVAAYGGRLDEESYAELELRREDTWKPNLKTRVVTTLALFPEFFHFTGKAAQNIGLRNLYAQANYKQSILWIGSRMYRGDDIYLLNWWPLDNQNTVGGGASYSLGRGAEGDTMLAVHVGMQRLDTPFQLQSREVPNPNGLGTVTFLQLDRPRTIETLKLTHFLRNGPGRQVFADDRKGIKLSLYGELHQLPAGVQRDPFTDKERGLPADSGWLAGAQFGYYAGVRDQFVNVFVRHARGLAAYDPLAIPSTFANDLTTAAAYETQIAASTNWESQDFGVQAAGYLRFFRDASPATTSAGKFDEGSVVVRPQWFVSDHVGLAAEASYQFRRTALPSESGDGVLRAAVTRLALMPYFSPAGRGSFKRPQLRVIYSVSLRDAGARGLAPTQDPASKRGAEHFLGLSAEWWFNSSSYP